MAPNTAAPAPGNPELMAEASPSETERRLLIGFYRGEDRAQRALDVLIDADFPLDRISVLGKAGGSGDDPLGVYYAGPSERMKAWGGMGAFWGGLWGLLSGAAGVFLVPGMGPVLAAGPVVNALIGGATGAGIGAGVMAGSAATSQIAVMAHRMGVPDERLRHIEQLLAEGCQMIQLIVGERESARWREILESTGPEPLWSFPYVGVLDGLHRAASGDDA
jgi:hypothetical protein